MYTDQGKVRWQTNTVRGGSSPGTLTLTDEGKLVLQKGGRELWNSGINKGIKWASQSLLPNCSVNWDQIKDMFYPCIVSLCVWDWSILTLRSNNEQDKLWHTIFGFTNWQFQTAHLAVCLPTATLQLRPVCEWSPSYGRQQKTTVCTCARQTLQNSPASGMRIELNSLSPSVIRAPSI